MIRAKRVEEGRDYLVKDMLSPQSAYLTAIEAFAKTQADAMDQIAESSDELALSAKHLIFGVGLLGVVLAMVIGVALTQSVTRQIGGEPADAVAAASAQISQGTLDLSQR